MEDDERLGFDLSAVTIVSKRSATLAGDETYANTGVELTGAKPNFETRPGYPAFIVFSTANGEPMLRFLTNNSSREIFIHGTPATPAQLAALEPFKKAQRGNTGERSQDFRNMYLANIALE